MRTQGSRRRDAGILASALSLTMSVAVAAPVAPLAPMTPDIPPSFNSNYAEADFLTREVMIPMRDGVGLHTVIVEPKNARRLPIMLTRTPYHADKRAERSRSTKLAETLAVGDDVFADGRYIRVFQDVRGKYGSEGDYVMTRPLIGPLNDTKVDHATDAWDTIDWLVRNLPESNGRVGMIGSSYEGFTVLMALTDPHPALKAAVPMSPMVDGWRGDDWFHNGAFRQVNIGYFIGQSTARGEGEAALSLGRDDYQTYLRTGSAADYARRIGAADLPYFRKLSEHPAYDAYWQHQALDRILAGKPLTVPTMLIAPLWDQEDSYGAIHVYRALEAKDARNDLSYLVMGPWRHSGVNYIGSSLGVLDFGADTAAQFRREVMLPFLDSKLQDAAPRADTPPVLAWQTGANRWQRLDRWPGACASGCATTPRALYLQPGLGLGFEAPARPGFDEYVSDPAKPVPFVPRPVQMGEGEVWKPWLVSDQRAVSDRPDVLDYVGAPLAEPLAVAGTPQVRLTAATSGTDADWVVKLVDVYPDAYPARPELGGYELPVAMEIFRGRYRQSLEKPAPLRPDAPLDYAFDLPEVNHVFLPGHRVAVQVQSSWFPLYDRNPQTFVPNIFFARAGDYRVATQRVYYGPSGGKGTHASAIELPVVPTTVSAPLGVPGIPPSVSPSPE